MEDNIKSIKTSGLKSPSGGYISEDRDKESFKHAFENVWEDFFEGSFNFDFQIMQRKIDFLLKEIPLTIKKAKKAFSNQLTLPFNYNWSIRGVRKILTSIVEKIESIVNPNQLEIIF